MWRRSSSVVFRLQIALAVIAALRAARRAVAVGFRLVARARLVAAGALYQHAAALAVGDQRVLARGLERLFSTRRIASIDRHFIRHRPREFRARQCRDLFAKLLTQHAG